MIIEGKMELLMLLIGLENAPELILDDERSEEWHKVAYMKLLNKVSEEYNAIVEEEDQIMVELLAEGYDVIWR